MGPSVRDFERGRSTVIKHVLPCDQKRVNIVSRPIRTGICAFA